MKKTLTALTALSFTLQANDNLNQQIADSALNKSIQGGVADISVSKTVSLSSDADNSGNLTVGDTLTYQISTTNNTNFGASGSFLNDTIDTNTSLVTGTVTTNYGNVVTGNNASDTNVAVSFGTLNGNTTANVQFSVLVVGNNQPFGFTISNQAQYTSNNFGSAVSDDPSQPGVNDPTLSAVFAPPTPVPMNSTFGLFAIILSILASVKLFFSKKKIPKQ